MGSSKYCNQNQPERLSPKCIIVTLTNVKDKERILKKTREKYSVEYKVKPITLTADFSADVLQARREWDGRVCAHQGNKILTQNTIPSKASL